MLYRGRRVRNSYVTIYIYILKKQTIKWNEVGTAPQYYLVEFRLGGGEHYRISLWRFTGWLYMTTDQLPIHYDIVEIYSGI